MKNYPTTIAGYPVELSLAAPTDKIVCHPDVFGTIAQAILRNSVGVKFEVKTEQMLREIGIESEDEQARRQR